MTRTHFFAFAFFLLFELSIATEIPAIKRTSINIPLAKLSVFFEDKTNSFTKVRIMWENETDYIDVTCFDDWLFKIRPDGRERVAYQESFGLEFVISDFEAGTLIRVNNSLITTLKLFERLLQDQKWDKLAYLDAFFPRFLKGYYFMYGASRNSFSDLPPISLVSDESFESSLNSKKTDARILKWQQNSEKVIRLRIVSKELVFQLETLQKKELANKKRNVEISYGEQFEETFAMFVKLYFNL